MANTKIPYSIVVEEKIRYILNDSNEIIKNEKIEEGTLLKSLDSSHDLHDKHI